MSRSSPKMTHMNDTPPTKLWPLTAMAHRLRVSRAWLRAEAEAGRVPALPTGDGFLFDAEAVEAALLERARHPVEAKS